MRNVLFVCTHNAGRSQMPNVMAAMREIGLDLADRRPQKLTVEMQLHTDFTVTLACGGTCP